MRFIFSSCVTVSQLSALGSAAAWAQAEFWGGAVKEGSWFATLQSAGMKMAV